MLLNCEGQVLSFWDAGRHDPHPSASKTAKIATANVVNHRFLRVHTLAEKSTHESNKITPGSKSTASPASKKIVLNKLQSHSLENTLRASRRCNSRQTIWSKPENLAN